jgi:hypothetical protein
MGGMETEQRSMRIKLVTAFDRAFFDARDDFWKAFALSAGIAILQEIKNCVELMAISPTGFARQMGTGDRLHKAPCTKQYFLMGTNPNRMLAETLGKTTVIAFKINALRYPTAAAAQMNVEFRREGRVIGKIGFIFDEDGAESVCAGRFGIDEPAEEPLVA